MLSYKNMFMNASSRQKAKHNYCYHEEGEGVIISLNIQTVLQTLLSTVPVSILLPFFTALWAKGSMLLLPHAVNRQNIGLGSDYLCSRTCSILMYYIIMIIRVRD